MSDEENDHSDEASTGESTKVGGGVDTKRNQVVARVRLVVFLVLLAVAVAVSFSVYHYTKNQELDAFENHFNDQATKVVQAFKFNAERRMEALEAFSTQITSYAISSNSTFPFVALPDFERHATHTLQLAEVVALLVFPIITAENRQKWEAYSRANQGWLVEGLALQQTSGGDEEALGRLQGEFDKGNIVEDGTIDPSQYQITPVIYKVKPGTTEAEYEDSNGPYTVSRNMYRPVFLTENTFLNFSFDLIRYHAANLADGSGDTYFGSGQFQHIFASCPCSVSLSIQLRPKGCRNFPTI